MPAVIPRWEWRTFGDRFGPTWTAFASMTSTGIQESDELYLVVGDAVNVKIRDGLLDIKLLREVDAHGLERWEPVLKAAFPITGDAAGEVARALGVEGTDIRPSPSVEDFLDQVAVGSSPVRAVPVHKRRVRYLVGGCVSEVTTLTLDGRSTRTIAIESEDADAVVAAVRSVGLAGYVNTGYPRGLRRIVEDAPARYAVIDAGTNSVKFHLAEVAGDGTWRTIADRAEVTRLGEGLAESGVISDAALDRTAAAISGMAAEARASGTLAIAAVGTAGWRLARNAPTVIEAIRERAGVTVEVISGEEESRLAYLAVAAEMPMADGTTVVFDTGGGSSQFTFGQGPSVTERFSVDVGAARYTERFGLDGITRPARLTEALAAVETDLARLGGRSRPDALVGMGGAITNLTAVSLGMSTYDASRIQGATLGLAEVDRQIERYRSLDADARRAVPGLQPKRAEIILAGACIVRTVMRQLGHTSLTVSDRGLRHGVLAERFVRHTEEPSE